MYTKLKSYIQEWKKSKFGWLTIMAIAVGGTIGAGIFFKNGEIFKNSQHQIGMAVASWIVAGIGVLAIALALVELSKANLKSSEGPLAWTNTYAWKWVKKSARSFMYWIYLPISMFALPIYFVMSIQDGTGFELSGGAVIGIAAAVSVFFIVLTGLSTKISANLQWVITIFKLLPIIAVIILGLQTTEPTHLDNSKLPITDANYEALDNGDGLSAKFAFLGVFASLPAILFAYDGFYMASTLSQDMKKPKKLPLALLVAIIIITGTYVLITIAIGDRSSIFGIGLSDKWLKVINISIAVAILGVINGFAIGIPKMLNEAIECDEIIGSKTMKKIANKSFKINIDKENFKFKLYIKVSIKHFGWIFALLITTLIFIIFTPIALYVFEDNYGGDYGTSGAGELYSTTDYLTNWTSLLIFVYIGLAILGAFVGWAKMGKLKSKGWTFIISAIISTIMLASGLIYYISNSIYIAANDSTVANWIYVFIPVAFIIISIILELNVKGREEKANADNSAQVVDKLSSSSVTKQIF